MRCDCKRTHWNFQYRPIICSFIIQIISINKYSTELQKNGRIKAHCLLGALSHLKIKVFKKNKLLNFKVNLSALSLKSSDTLLTPLGSHFSRFLNFLPLNIYIFFTSNISIGIVLSKLKTGSRVFEDDIFFRESSLFLHEVRNFCHVSAFRIVALR